MWSFKTASLSFPHPVAPLDHKPLRFLPSLAAPSNSPTDFSSNLLASPLLPKVELLSHALEDLARSCMYRVVLAFGASSMKQALKEAKQKPVYGTMPEVQALLLSMLEFQD
jgi:hypothetical protein